MPSRRPTPAPAPANDDLGLVDALAQLAFTVHGSLGRTAAAHGLSAIQLRLLGILRDRRPTITDLATLLQLDKSSVTGLVDRAEDRGLVERVPSERDGRSVLVVITAAGRRLVGQGAAEFAAEVAELVADMSPGQRAGLSAAASAVVAADARRRGVDIFTVEH